MSAQVATDRALEAQSRVNDAVAVVAKMKADPALADLLAKAEGLVIVPHFTQGALVFGGRAGSGLLVVRHGRIWSSPAFYKLGGGTFGVQLGGSAGSLAMLLMTEQAVDAFENKSSTWSMSAGAGLQAISYSKQTPDAQSLSDVIVWSDMKGLFGGAAVGATNVSRDLMANQAYYRNPDVTAQQILNGLANNPDARVLLDAMPLPKAPPLPPAPLKKNAASRSH